jgi:hypothetical protein
MAVKARKCFTAASPSRWVHKVFLTCDNQLAVQFRHGQRIVSRSDAGPGRLLGEGGAPGVCCLYPGTKGERAETLYDLALVWAYAGEWVHAFLYKKYGYKIIAPPEPCGNCATTCSTRSSLNPSPVGEPVTFTATVENTDGDTAAGDAPEGSVDFLVNGVVVCSGVALTPGEDDDSGRTATATCTYTFGSAGVYTVRANFNPAVGSGFLATNCQITQTVTGGITTACCPGVGIPGELHITLSNGTGTCACLNGQSWQVAWNGVDWSNPYVLCGRGGSWDLTCSGTPAKWRLTSTGCDFITPAADASSCNPLSITWAGVAVLGCCHGNIDITVTP